MKFDDLEITNKYDGVHIKSDKKLYSFDAWEYIHTKFCNYFKAYCYFDLTRKDERKRYTRHLREEIERIEEELERLKLMKIVCSRNKCIIDEEEK